MKKIIIVVFIPIILMSCTGIVAPVATEMLVPTVAQTNTPLPTVTATPPLLSWQWSNALVTFNDMTVLSESEVWAVGQHGTIVHARPHRIYSTDPYEYPGEFSFAGGGYLGAIDFISENDGWLTAWGGQIFHWDGQNWTESIPLNWEPTWFDIEFAKSDLGWVVGCYQNGGDNGAVIWQWNGSSWENISLPSEINHNYCFTDINVVSENDVWVVGNRYEDSILLHWDGLNWQESSTQPSRRGFAVGAVSTGEVWVLGFDGIDYWNGSEWTFTEMKVYFQYGEGAADPAILAISQNNVWVGGSALFHWNGSEWKNTAYDVNYGYIVDIETDANGKVWALTLSGTILQLFDR
jgi:hypothetical protein